jgi:hypothetical protein
MTQPAQDSVMTAPLYFWAISTTDDAFFTTPTEAERVSSEWELALVDRKPRIIRFTMLAGNEVQIASPDITSIVESTPESRTRHRETMRMLSAEAVPPEEWQQ